MPKIWLPDGVGVNRKARKVPFTDLTGVQRIAKAGWANTGDGVNRKVYSSADCSAQGSNNYSWVDMYSVRHTYNGTINPDGTNLSAYINLNPATINSSTDAATVLTLKFDSPISYAANSPIISINQFIISYFNAIKLTASIRVDSGDIFSAGGSRNYDNYTINSTSAGITSTISFYLNVTKGRNIDGGDGMMTGNITSLFGNPLTLIDPITY